MAGVVHGSRQSLLAACAAALICAGSAGAAPCRQALALGLDVSGSVDTREYRMQLDGLAAALRDPDVVGALLSVPGAPVRIAIYEWSGTNYQRILVGWTAITGPRALDDIAARLAGTNRSPAPPETALGAAMQFGVALIAEQSSCWKRTVDISGDGRHNAGLHPRDVRAALEPLGFTLNGLVIGVDGSDGSDRGDTDIAALSSYFRAWVIFGPDAFVETALGFQDYQAAMTRKLLRELETAMISAVLPDRAPPRR